MQLLRSHSIIFLLFICLLILLVNFFEINSIKPCGNAFLRYQKSLLSNYSQETSVEMSTIKPVYESESPKIEHTKSQSKSPKLKFKTILEILPHTQAITNCDPEFEITKNRSAKIVMGISTIKREQMYLYDTLNSIMLAVNYDQKFKNDLLLIISIPEFDDEGFLNQTISKILSLYPKEFESGFIDIIQPSKAFYPNFNKTLTDFIYNDSALRIKWRKKQNFDVSYLMNYAKDRGTYYLHLEDDILCQVNFISEIFKFIDKNNQENNNRWAMIEFSELGFIGKLFRTKDLPIYINMFVLFSDYKPIDLLHNYIFEIMACDSSKPFTNCKQNFIKVKVTFKPSLFQHIGLKSSLKGKIQKIKDKKFEEIIPVLKHENPPANINTSFKFYDKHTFEKLYNGVDFMWANEAAGKPYIIIDFNKSVLLNGYIIKSGTSLHPDDKLPLNTTLEIKPSDDLKNSKNLIENRNFTITTDNYFIIDRVTDNSGNLIYDLNQSLMFNISNLRLNVPSFSGDKWILLYEFGIF